MIRRLAQHDCDAARILLRRSVSANLYLLSNMDQLGFQTEYCEFWGDFADSNGTLRGILNRYMSGWSVYGLAEADWHGLASTMDDHPEIADRLQDNPGGTSSFLPFLERYGADRTSHEELMDLRVDDFNPYPAPKDVTVRRAESSDLEPLVVYYADAGSMTRSRNAVERPVRDLRVWIAEKDEQILSAALTNAELSHSAMVGGVYTRPEARGCGYGSAVCSALCAELLQEGKQPVLYWEAPAAGFIYWKLGFRAIGKWRSVWLVRK